jgi:chromosome segregation ATPase
MVASPRIIESPTAIKVVASPRSYENKNVQLRDQQKRNNYLKSRVDECEKMITELEDVVSAQRDEIRRLTSQKLTLEDRLRRTTEEVHGVEVLRHQVEALQDERRKLSDALHHQKTLSTTNNCDQERLRILYNSTCEELDQVQEQLDKERKVVETLRRELDDLTLEVAQKSDRLEDLEKKLRNSERARDTRMAEMLERHEMEVQNLKGKIAEHKESYETLLETHEQIKGNYVDQHNADVAQIQELQQQKEAHESLIQKLFADEETLIASLEVQEKRVREEQEKREQIEQEAMRQLKSEKAENSALRENLRILSDQKKDLQKKNNELTEESDHLKIQNEDLQRRLRELQSMERLPPSAASAMSFHTCKDEAASSLNVGDNEDEEVLMLSKPLFPRRHDESIAVHCNTMDTTDTTPTSDRSR